MWHVLFTIQTLMTHIRARPRGAIIAYSTLEASARTERALITHMSSSVVEGAFEGNSPIVQPLLKEGVTQMKFDVIWKSSSIILFNENLGKPLVLCSQTTRVHIDKFTVGIANVT